MHTYAESQSDVAFDTRNNLLYNKMANKQEQQCLTEFIEIYKNNPCLWKIKSKEYSDKQVKNAAYNLLIEKLKEVNESATKEDVVKKISSLRSCFRKEYKKVMASRRTGSATEDIYTPNLWYFELLLFLKDHEIPRETIGNDNLNCSDLLIGDDTNEANGNSDLFLVEETVFSPTPSASSTSTTKSRPISKKRPNSTDNILNIIGKKINESKDDDEYDIIGKNIAMKMRKLRPEMQLYAEKIINEVLFEAQLGTLNRFSRITSETNHSSNYFRNGPTSQESSAAVFYEGFMQI